MRPNLLIAFSIMLCLQACKHPLAIQGNGDIVDLNGGHYGCTLEQFQASAPACLENNVQGGYFVNYAAVPRSGWRFDRWEGSCGHLSEGNNCRFDVPNAWVTAWDSAYGDFPIPALTAVFAEEPPVLEYTEARVPCADRNPERNAYFGDLHIHTTYSMDAWTWGTTVQPRDTYAHAKSIGLDFAAVTDHSEFLGELQLCTTPGTLGYNDPLCVTLRDTELTSTERRSGLSAQNPSVSPIREPSICGADETLCLQAITTQWQKTQAEAAEHYDPTSELCDFTTFVAYEWTGAVGGSIHRNVIFRNNEVPDIPISHFEAPVPEKLWQDLEDLCLNQVDSRCDVLAIPHNSNAGNGVMFLPDYAGAAEIEEEVVIATRRARVEPLLEVFQHKGQSECEGGYTDAFGMVDELCDFEYLDFSDDPRIEPVPSDFLRGSLGTGLSEQARLGVNPFKTGVIASTDTHGGISTVDEASYQGNLGPTDENPATRLRGKSLSYNPGGLAGVWAVENSRDAVFDALIRREVFGTSGPRIVPRMFGGWSFDSDSCQRNDRAAHADENGVPMGGNLPAPPPGAVAPIFLVWAQADRTPLQRIQIIKGYLDPESGPQTLVYDIAGSPNSAASVNESTCETSPTGEMELCAMWTDPNFSAAEAAYYYVRAVEDPVCRWSTQNCLDLPAALRDSVEGCQDEVPKILQERAWTSPIWFTPQ